MKMPSGSKGEKKKLQDINKMKWKELTVEGLRVNVTRAANGRSPGPEKYPSFWIKQIKTLHKPLAEAY